MLDSRLSLSVSILSETGIFLCSLNDNESANLDRLAANGGYDLDRLGEFVWRTRNTDNRVISNLSVDHEYVHVYARPSAALRGRMVDRSDFKNPDNDLRGPYVTDPLSGKANAAERPNLHYVIVNPATGDKYYPHPDFGWITNENGFKRLLANSLIYWPTNPKTGNPRKKRFASESNLRTPISSLAISIKQGEGNLALAALFGGKLLNFPKPVSVMRTLIDCAVDMEDVIVDYFAGSGTTGHAVIDLNRQDGGRRRFILVEMSDYFDTMLLPRIAKVTFTPQWKDGKPKRPATPEEAERSPRMVKIIRLESYEDALNNLDLRRTQQQQSLLDLAETQGADGLKEQYILRYMLDVETRGNQSLLNIAAFADPTAYTLKAKRPGSDESREVNVDLLETFNYLIGLTVQHIAAPRTFSAEFERDGEGRLRIKGRLKPDDAGLYWFRTVTGTTPDGRKTLVIWRKRPGGETAEGIEQDNLVLDEWFTKQGYSAKDREFDLIYVNGDNNLENLKASDDTWKVRLIEEDFHRLMFDTEGA